MTDYYAVLGISHAAEQDEVAKAYRRLALSTNPSCNPDHATDPAELKRLFTLASQAYVVISDPKLRAIYDQFGDDGVRHGGTGTSGVPGGLDVDGIDADAVFRQFFGVDSPFQVINGVSGMDSTQHRFYSTSAAEDKNPPKAPLNKVKLDITLEDAFEGRVRTVQWQNKFVSNRGEITSDASFSLAVPKGIAHGNKVTLEGKGNTQDGRRQGDVEVEFNVVAHDYFRRQGDDLLVTCPITLADALSGVTLDINTIDGRQLSVLVDEVVHPKFQRVVAGQGMPIRGAENKRGNLIVECATQFPAYLTAEQKSEIRRILTAQ